MARCLVSLGANLGARAETLAASLTQLAAVPGITQIAVSSLHQTTPVGGPAHQPGFLNQAALFETSLSPHQFFRQLTLSEQSAGRTRVEHWGPRTLDLDLLLYDDLVLTTPELTLPHPRMALRHFVLAPAVEVAPTWLHPQIGWTIAQLWQHLQSAPPYLAIAGPPAANPTALATRLATELALRFVPLTLLPNSPRPSSPPSLESLRLAAQQLDRQQFQSATSTWTVSDFWFDQLALDQSDPQRLQVWQQLHPHVQPPKLLIHLEEPTSLQESESFAAQLKSLASQSGIGPVLHLPAYDPETVWNEITAALQSMKPSSLH
jgi:2-amino-4-hydroxy-6-hydroxymethyldihydropteridine diphosphokinase